MENTYIGLNEKLSRLQWLMHRCYLQNHVERGPMADPTRGQGRVLKMLKMQPEISTKDLSYVLGIRQQSLNELLNKMEKGGYITREPSEADRRIMMIRLTDKGKSEQQSDTEFLDIFECLTPEEQATLGNYFDRIIAALEAQLGVGDEEDVCDWMKTARSRMGEEHFERLMALRDGRAHYHGPHHGGPDEERFGHGFCGFGGFAAEDCGSAHFHGEGKRPEERHGPDEA